MGAVARVAQFIPVIFGVIVIAIGAYYLVSVLKSPMRAKEIFITAFTAIFAALAVVCALCSAYALFENNIYVLEITGFFLAVALVGLAIVRFCHWRLMKKNPKYKDKTYPTEYLK